MLETKHDKLHLAYSDPRRDHEFLAEMVTQLQTNLEDLDNRNRCNNLRIRGSQNKSHIYSQQLIDCSRPCYLIPQIPLLAVTESIGLCASNHQMINHRGTLCFASNTISSKKRYREPLAILLIYNWMRPSSRSIRIFLL